MNVEMIAKKKPHSFTAKKVVGISVWLPSPTYYTFEQGFTQPHLTYQRQTVRGGKKICCLFSTYIHEQCLKTIVICQKQEPGHH